MKSKSLLRCFLAIDTVWDSGVSKLVNALSEVTGRITLTGCSEKDITMAKVKHTDQVWVPMLKPGSGNCTIKFDEPLDALLDAQGIEDPGEQMVVCDALCALGLAKRKTFTDDKLGSQEHNFTSTKPMRKLAKEWLYSD